MYIRLVPVLFLLAGCASQKQPAPATEPVVAALQNHVRYLADDKLQGRRTGTEGERLAAEYIADAFGKAGLQPKGSEGWYQRFSVSEGRAMGPATSFSVNGNALKPGEDFFAMAWSGTGTVDAMPSVSLMERGEPWFLNTADLMRDNKANPHFDAGGAVLQKAKDAGSKGATALVVYNGGKTADGLLFDAKEKTPSVSIPVIYVSKPAADKYFKDASASVELKGRIDVVPFTRSGTNVVGYVDKGAARTVVIGAHFDHLGYGEDRNSLNASADGQIHNGADDNASGTAALLELARMVKASNLKNNNYLFIAFSGEELGLYGSKHFTQQPTVDLASVNFMVNMDMVGRLNDSSKVLTVGGYGTSLTWGQLYGGNSALYKAAQYRFDSSGTGPSDHTSFYLKNIPVLFYFTGLHSDYHKPSDDAGKINYNGQAAIVKHIYSLLQATDRLNAKLVFTKTREQQTTTTARFSVSLGIMPDYTFGGTGVRADGVTDGRPAQKAGLKAGDVITAIGEYKVATMEAYMQTLGKFKKGDKTTVQYTRDGKPLSATVEF